MGLLDRFRRGTAARRSITRTGAAEARYPAEWVRARTGVEGFVEPQTIVTDVTMVLVAADGEWTRRVVGERGARRLGREPRIPVYDVSRTGYPQRMRDDDARRRIERGRDLERELGEQRSRSRRDAIARIGRPHPGRADPPPCRILRSRYSAAMSSSTAMSVRTGTPVPPLPM